jgi:hypothetical protein
MTRQGLKVILEAILESVKIAGPIGAPGGHIYAALMAVGFTFDQYNQIMSGMVKSGYLTKKGECYHIGPKIRVQEGRTAC